MEILRRFEGKQPDAPAQSSAVKKTVLTFGPKLRLSRETLLRLNLLPHEQGKRPQRLY